MGLLSWIPYRWHFTKTVAFPPYEDWERPLEETVIIRIAVWKKVLGLLLLLFAAWACISQSFVLGGSVVLGAVCFHAVAVIAYQKYSKTK